MFCKNKKGFTLVELLIVIAILSILSLFAMVNLNIAKDKATEASIWSTLSSIRQAATICIYDDQPLKCGDDGNKPCEGGHNFIPVAGNLICKNSSAIWPDLKNDCYSWVKPSSNLETAELCLEIAVDIVNCSWLNSTSAFYTCTETICPGAPTATPVCQDACSPEGEVCVNNHSCCGHNLYCRSNICELKPGH